MRLIVGPTLDLLRAVGLAGPALYLCTAFYSKSVLGWIGSETTAKKVFVGVRIDLTDIEAWCAGYIDPVALLEFLDRLGSKGTTVQLFGSTSAHAKLFVGGNGVIVGSANLSMRGFGAGPEIVSTDGPAAVSDGIAAANRYLATLRHIEIAELRRYVTKNRAQAVREIARRKLRQTYHDQDRLPETRVQGKKAAAGDYGDFVQWLDRLRFGSAHTIAERARGKSQLSGHINRNFHGLRQHLLSNPDALTRFRGESPDTYKLSADPIAEASLARFVHDRAVDENHFSLNTWRTYLPIECGGRATRHGGSIGNLNRMLPLVARYLTRRTRSRL
jgi:hypothetical protein